MKKLYKLLLICLLIIAGGGNALKAQSYNSDNSETANRAETPTYISKIAVAYGAEASTPKDILKNNGFTIIDKDLNAGCGSNTHYIYMGYKTTTNPADAITGIYIREGNDTPNSATFDGVTAYLLGGSTEDNPGENKPVDLNIDAGGATLHVYVSRNTNLAAITDIKFSNTNSMSGYVTQNIDLNKGASGEYIYLHYKQYSAQVYANFHYINESCQSVSKKFYGTLLHHLDDAEITPSIPTLLTYDDRSLAFASWKDNTEAMVDYEYTSKININLESSGMTFYGLYYFSPQTPLNLRFDANGGTGAPEDQKTDIYGLRFLNAGNGTPVYELSTFQIPNNICTKVGTCKFLGWSTDPNANSAEYQPGQSIDIALNTTLYAIYDSAHEYENGYCSICGAYEPAELVNGYYQIKTADNLFWFAEYVNHIDRTASAKLMNDIDLENRPWTPIGTTGESSHNFRGHFDGNGKTITGLNVEVTRSGGGFFGEVRLGTVEDFTIYGEVKLNGNHSYVGGVIGSAPGANSNQPEHNGATIRNITSYVNVTLGEGSHGSNRVAGFIGYANHETLIENCTWYGTLDLGPYRAQDGVGGLVGKANDNSEITIRNCAAYGTIKTSYQSGSYNSHNSIYIGGIVSNSVASAQTTLENCIWAGTLIDNTNLGSNAHISAIGTLDGSKSVTNCYALDNMPYITTNNAHNTGITEVTAEQLASGEIAYKLQGTQATQIWGQNIDNGETADSKPILGGAKVYEIIYSGGGIYTNTIITASGRCGINLYWKVSDNTLTIFGTGAMNNYSGTGHIAPWRSLIPAPTSLVLEEGITHIGDYAFAYCSSFTGSLTIPNSVTSIGNSAFYECSDFNGSLTIGNSVKSIGNNAFYECSGFKGSLTIPNSVTTIGEDAFSRCSGFTGSLTIPNSVTSIGNSAFSSCSGFTGSLTIGNSVTTIGEDAFYLCKGFTEVYSSAETAPTFGYAAFYFDTNSNATLYYPASSEQSYEEKGWFKHYFSKCIGINGICGDNLYWKVSDNTLTILGSGAMEDYDNIDNKAPWRSLNPAPTSLVLEEGITYIGFYAFYGCDGFTKVHSSAVIAPTLGTEAFANINENAILCHPVSSEPSYKEKGWFEYFRQHVGADGQCGDNLFWHVDDENILTIFGTGAMYDYGSDNNKAPWRSLNPAPTSLILEEGITHIGNSAFHGCSSFNGSLTIPNSVTTIGVSAFDNCPGFTGDLTIPNNVTSIGKTAFWACKGLTGSLTIPNSVTTIGDYAFQFCNGFTEVYSLAETAPTLGTSVFSGISSDATLYYLTSSEQSYNDKGWFNYFPQHIGLFDGKCGDNLYWVVNDNVLTISGTGSMYDYEYNGDNISPWRKLETAPTSLLLEEGVTHIGNFAFYNCKGFTGSLTIPNSVTSIGESAFDSCTSFKGDLTIPNSVTTIGNAAFQNCSGFNGSLTIPNSVTTIGDYAFQNCSGFTEVYSSAVTAPTLLAGAFDKPNNATLYYPVSSEQSYKEKGWFNYFPQHVGVNGKCGDNLYWKVSDNTLTIFGTGAMYDYDDSNNKAPWRSLNPAPTSLVLEEGITYIGNYAFYGCDGFTKVYSFAETVPTLGTDAFANINVNATLYYPASSEPSYDDKGWFNYFSKCIGFKGKCGDNLYWAVSDNVLTIFGTGAMDDYEHNGDNISPWRKLETAPTSLLLEEGVTHIGNFAFYNCSDFTGSLTIPNSVTTIGNNAFQLCISFKGSLTIGNSVTTIGNDAFYSCSGFTGSLTIPNSVTSIGNYAFFDCYGFNGYLTIGNSVTSIGNYAFDGCSGFDGSLTIPNSVTTIGNSAFKNCSGFKGSLTIPNSVTSIGNNAFHNCKGFTGSLTIPNSVTTIGNYTFQNCSGFTGSLTIPNSVTTIGSSAFQNCSGFNGSLTIPNSVTSIRDYAFYQCSGFDGSLTIPNSVTSIGSSAFRDCSGFTGSLTIPNSVTSIGNYAFQNCSAFNGSLTIPNSVTTIGNAAFYNCDGFTEVYSFAETAPTLGKDAFDMPNNATLYYPVSSEQSYKEKGWFNYFPQHIGFNGKCGDNLYWYVDDENTLTIFGTGAMYDYGSDNNKAPWRSLNLAPKSLVLEEGITHIGNSAFHGCSSFNGSLTIPNSVITIGVSAFDNCGFTGDLTIPNNVTSIGKTAFWACKGFTGSLTIPNSVTTIGDYAFQFCDGFTKVYSFAETAPTLGTAAFAGINNNAILYYPASSEQSYDGNGWFNYFTKRIGFNGKCGDNLYWHVDENNALTIYGTGAMDDYDNIDNKAPWLSLNPAPTSLVLEKGITYIGNYAFYECYYLTEVHSSAVIAPTLGTEAFANINENAILYHPVSSEPSYEEKGWFEYFLQHVGADGQCGDNLFWYVDDENTLTIFGTGAMYDYGSDNNKAPWRSLNLAPKSLVLEEGITHIGNSAFHGCSSFNGSLTIPNSVITIGVSAFDNCGFTGDLTIPNNVTSIGKTAFWACKGFTGSLTIPNSVTSIGDYAFQYCDGFTEVYSLAKTAPTLGTKAFTGTNSNAILYYPILSEPSYEEKGWFDYFPQHIGLFDGKCGDNLYWAVNENVLMISGAGAMYDYDNIDNKAPWRSLIPAPTSLVLEEGITHIGNAAFYGCEGLIEVHSSAATAPTLGTEAFANINENAILYHPVSSEPSYEEKGWFKYFIQHVVADGKCGDNLFWYVDDENILTIFGTGAMYDYGSDNNKAPWRSLNLAPKSLVLEEGITHIGNSAFHGCSTLTGSLTIPNSVTTIGVSAFDNCGFTGDLTIPNNVTSIGKTAFWACKGFTGSLTIPNSVTTIGDYAFQYCDGFTGSLTIGNSVTTIGNNAFQKCSGFTEIFFYRDTNPTIRPGAFSDIYAKVCAPVIWESFRNIPSGNLVKMATFVGEQTTDASTGSATINGWVGLAEDQTWPDEDDHVAINAPMVISGQRSAVSGQQSANSLSVKSFGLCGNGTTVNGSITIEDGAQLYCEIANGVVTVKKEILGYQQSAVSGQQSESESKWYTIASPLKDTIQIIPNSSFLTSNSDLYRYDEPSYTWQNAKNSANNGFNTIDPGRGYLYANAENTTLEFTGMINTDKVTYSLTTDGIILKGFHLVGNPFTHNITFAHLNATEGAELVNGYYVLNGEGAWGATLGSNEDDVIKVGQGVLVKAKTEGTLAISRQPSAVSRQRSGKGQQTTDNGQQSLCISVSNAKYSDRAFVVFDKGVGLDKMNHENENIPLLYIPMEDADYAIAMMDINVNEIPVNFETNVMGQYTISLRQENCEFDELYLLDKQTGEKVNILEQDYTFIATSSENPERFILMKDNGQQTTDNRPWVYVNNGDIVIYNIEGDADIKIFDALGRCVYHGESSDETTRIANGYSSGVYMIQKVDDKGVNVQKIIL